MSDEIQIVEEDACEFIITDDVSLWFELELKEIWIIGSQDDERDPVPLYDLEGWHWDNLSKFEIEGLVTQDQVFEYCKIAGLFIKGIT